MASDSKLLCNRGTAGTATYRHGEMHANGLVLKVQNSSTSRESSPFALRQMEGNRGEVPEKREALSTVGGDVTQSSH